MGWWEDLLEDTIRNFNVGSRGASDLMRGLDDDLAKEKGVWARIAQSLVKAFHIIFQATMRLGHTVFPGPIADPKVLFAVNAANVPKGSWDETVEILARNFGLTDEEKGMLKSYGQGLQGTSPIIQGLGMLLIYVGIMQFLMGPGLGKISQGLFSRFRPSVPDPGAAVGAAALDPELDKRIWSIMERNGYSKEDIEVLFASVYARIPVEFLRDIYYREGKSVEWLDHRLEELRFTPERREEVKATFPSLPSIQDLIYMQGREAFEEDMVELFGLDDEPPGDILEATRKQGIDDDWVKRYWRAHWTHPSWNQVMEMLHRGVIDWPTVYHWYRAVEIPPFWREAMTKISFTPYTRVDVRRMHAMGILNDEQLVVAYKDLGFDQEHAENMAQFTKRYNMSAELNEYRDLIIKRYRNQAVSYQEALSSLQSIGFTQEKAEYYLSKADYDEWLEQQDLQVENVKLRYQARIIDRRTAHDELNRLNLPATQADNNLLKWDSGVLGADKFPSKTDLEKFLQKGIIDESTWRYEMSQLGYKPVYVDWYYKEITAGK